MTTARRNLGDAGERYAERRLSEQGWQILDRNWRGDSGEVDLVADDGECVVFVEVKTRRGESHGRAEETITPSKSARLIQLGAQYVSEHSEIEDRFWRIDLVAITLDRAGRISRFTHIQDACLDE
jgi:putative endonuclease